MLRKRSNNLLHALFSFSQRERRRVLLLLPLLVVLCLLFTWQGKPRFEQSFTRYADLAADSLQRQKPPRDNRYHDRTRTTPGASRPEGEHIAAVAENRATTRPERPHNLFAFDPNLVSKEELVALGFSPKQAQAILNYRQAGAQFRKPEDFASCYTVSPEKFRELAPYIRIAAERGPNPQHSASQHSTPQQPAPALGTTARGETPPSIPTAPTAPTASTTSASSQPTPPATDVPARPAHRTTRLELNSADSASLVAIHGIGALTAGRILRYRETLGGYASEAQLQEVAGMTDRNYQLILQQIWVDSSKIQKIDINFASPKRMQGHPYLPPKVLDKILKYRQLRGGWSSTGDLIEQHILSAEQAERLAPYLFFRAQ